MYKKIVLITFGFLGSGLYAMVGPKGSTFDVKLVNATKNDVQLKFVTNYERKGVRPKGFLDAVLVLGAAAGIFDVQVTQADNVKVNLKKGGGYEYDITLKPETSVIVQDIQPGDTLYAVGSMSGYRYAVPLDKARDLVNQKKGQQKGPGKDLVVIVITPATIAGYNFNLSYRRVTPKEEQEVKKKGWVAIEEEKVRID
jgi:hypothetical protein